MSLNREEAWLVFNLLPNIGPVKVRKLLDQFRQPESILAASVKDLVKVPGIGPELANTIINWQTFIDLALEKQHLSDHQITLLTQDQAEFPSQLLQVHDAPFLLYVWGKLQPSDQHAIGIVGSRQATRYGLDCTKRFAYQLAYAGFTVISGLARGIDTAAHEAALAAKGRTIAVIGSGIGKLYPPENMALAQKIISHGAVISEYPFLRVADKQTFPYRNRIVSGWSKGLLVVEAPLRSGSLITAQMALEQGRPVFSIPGGIDRPISAGCNQLIKQGATLVSDVQDIIDEVDCLFHPTSELTLPAPSSDSSSLPPLTIDEQILWNNLKEEELHIDELIENSGLTSATVSSTLMRLEMKKRLIVLPGKFYKRR
jgi:DNA processing protein